MNNTQNQKSKNPDNYDITATYGIMGDNCSMTFKLNAEEHKAIKNTERVYSILNTHDELYDENDELYDDAAQYIASTIENIARCYEYWADEDMYIALAQYCLAYLNITKEEERKDLGVEVEITEHWSELTKEEKEARQKLHRAKYWGCEAEYKALEEEYDALIAEKERKNVPVHPTVMAI